MDMSQYLGVFIDEAREHLQNLDEKLSELLEHQNDPELINSIFRSAHTLKGSSGQMGFSTMMELTHSMENVFDALRQKKAAADQTMVDVLYEALDLLEGMVDSVEKGGDDKKDTSAIVKKLQALLNGRNGDTPDSRAPEEQPDKAENGNAAASKLTFTDYEQAVIEQALAQHQHTFITEVILRKDCVLKAARALMVSNALEELGTIIKSKPSTEAIEKEAFESSIIYVVVTDQNADAVKRAVLGISEIEDIRLTPYESQLSAEPVPSATAASGNSAATGTRVEKPKKIAKTIRVNLDRLDRLLNLFEEMIIDRSRIEKISSALDNPELTDSVDVLKRVSGQLQETILNLRMEPVEQVFNRFPRMVRSLSRKLNKKVRLEISGAETELDRTVIDEIGDPLMHMIRNSMDHGIEHPDVRRKAGKDPEGTLNLRAYHSGNHVYIEIEDDGAGINREKVLAKAVEKGVVAADQASELTDKEIYHLLFASGFSTADKISDISGRGVGLDVVESKIRSLSGTVSVTSAEGEGSKFTIKLPLTLSIINAMLIRTGNETYAIPMSSIVETALERQTRIQSVGRQQVMHYQDHYIPVIDLKDYLQVPVCADSGKPVAGSRSIVLIRHGDKHIALLVDLLAGYQDIVIKPLGDYLSHVHKFSGATILGDGKVALILDCQELVETQKRNASAQNA
ncbi:chemotaxis protein CheA [Sporolactobacillus vineae]|uniref:chemotaxis protein CheA n=1 Tax=Sporolactobacillus vineae TaxID=444463 RepID=UPI00028A0DBD|nr:chemotaxis protein CheA [Sporolactobacillus vineae]